MPLPGERGATPARKVHVFVSEFICSCNSELKLKKQPAKSSFFPTFIDGGSVVSPALSSDDDIGSLESDECLAPNLLWYPPILFSNLLSCNLFFMVQTCYVYALIVLKFIDSCRC
jgi:hypothetical protein